MIETLPLVLFIVMTELSIGSFCVLFLLDWRNEVKRGFLVSYALIYLFLTGLTYLFQQSFSTQAQLDTFTSLDKAWTGYQGPTLLLFLLLLIPYCLFMLLDRKAGVDGKKEEKEGQGGRSLWRVLRLITGGLTVIAGVATLFVMAMIYRPLAPAGLGSVFTVATFFASALALGGVMTAMWLGHWYLVTPALSEKPLLFATTLVLVGVLTQVIFFLVAGPTLAPAGPTTPAAIQQTPAVTAATPAPNSVPQTKPANAPVVTPLGPDAIGWLRILVGFVMPLILGILAWKLVRDRSFQSATGMLYLIVVCALAGEAIARGLFLMRI